MIIKHKNKQIQKPQLGDVRFGTEIFIFPHKMKVDNEECTVLLQLLYWREERVIADYVDLKGRISKIPAWCKTYHRRKQI